LKPQTNTTEVTVRRRVVEVATEILAATEELSKTMRAIESARGN
jgi:hypothetical protein